jgi:hypothetical protein
MTRLLVLFVLFLAFFAVGCTPTQLQIQTVAANTVADVANSTLPLLVELYTQEGYRAIDRAKTEQEATDAVVAIEKNWKPVWQAWNTLRIAQDAWAKVIETKGDTNKAFQSIKDAYCGLLVVWPKTIPVVPMGAFVCGEVVDI